MELLKHINDMANTYTISKLLNTNAIVQCDSKEEFMQLIYKINCTSYLHTTLSGSTWDIYNNQDRYNGSMAIYFNSRHLEFCYVDYYKTYRRKNPKYKYSEVNIVTI
jgi:hypothetical protein